MLIASVIILKTRWQQLKERITKYICFLAVFNIIFSVIKAINFTFYYFDIINKDKKDPATTISYNINLFFNDLSFLILWKGIYESTKVLLLLNKKITNFE